MNWGQKKEFFLIFICSDKESQVWLGFCNHSFSKFGFFTASESSGDLQGHRKKKMPRKQTCSLKAEYLQDQSSAGRNASISTAVSIGRCSLVGFYFCTCIFQLGAQLSLAEHLVDCQTQLCAPGAAGQDPGKAHVAKQSCGVRPAWDTCQRAVQSKWDWKAQPLFLPYFLAVSSFLFV